MPLIMTVNFVRQQHISENVSSDFKKKTIVHFLSHHHSTFFKIISPLFIKRSLVLRVSRTDTAV